MGTTLLLCLVTGITAAALTYFLVKQTFSKTHVLREWYRKCDDELTFVKTALQQRDKTILALTAEAEGRIPRTELERLFVAKETFELVHQKLKDTESKAAAGCEAMLEVSKELVELRKENETLLERIAEHKQQLEQWHVQAGEQFKNLANDIFKEKGKDFAETNKLSMDQLLDPLKTDLNHFKKTIEDTRKEDIQDLTSLKKELESLQKLNTQLSDDAQRLASALKSDVKVQGDWGEDRLKLILEAEGLQRHIDYSSQGSYRHDDDDVLRRPDFIINLPDGKHVIVDSKVSLNAYVDYFNCTDDDHKRTCLKRLVRAINEHIDGLSAKNYQTLNGLNTPDFVCMFMHFEPALSMALNECPDILQRAMNKKIVILTPTTLVATAKMIRLIWQKESRAKNVDQIFKQCGLLYDKFVSFVADFEQIGDSLHAASACYKSAFDRLKDGKRRGDTILGRFENIKTLEAKTTKSLPPQLLNELDILDGAPLTIDVSAEK
jgi:DNA recombination protein RmuC